MMDQDWLADGIDAEGAGNAEEPDDRYRKLPERIRFEDMITSLETRPVPDPTMGRDTETDFLLRNADGQPVQMFPEIGRQLHWRRHNQGPFQECAYLDASAALRESEDAQNAKQLLPREVAPGA